MNGMKKMFNERGSGLINDLIMVKKELRNKLNTKFYEKKNTGPLYKKYFFCSMCSLREHPEQVFIIHFLNTVNVFVLFAHLLIIMNIYIRLPISVNITVLYYWAILCSICTVESDRNIKCFFIIICPPKNLFFQMFNSTNRQKQKSVFFGIEIFVMRFCKNCLS